LLIEIKTPDLKKQWIKQHVTCAILQIFVEQKETLRG